MQKPESRRRRSGKGASFGSGTSIMPGKDVIGTNRPIMVSKEFDARGDTVMDGVGVRLQKGSTWRIKGQ